MKNNLLLLLKVRMLRQLGLNTFIYEKDKKKRLNKILITIVIGFVVFMFVNYCAGIAFGLHKLHAGKIIPVYAFLICSILALFFTVLKANGELFAFKDYDLVMSLPINTSTVIASRFLSLYIWNTLLSCIVLIPMGVVYAIFENAHFFYYFMWPISILTISLIPTTLATIIGALITAISSKFRYANIINTILSLAILITLFSSGVLFGNTSNKNFDISKINNILESGINKIYRVYPLAKIFNKAIVEGNLVYFIIFIVISITWYYLFIKALSLKYKAINTGISSHSSCSDYKINVMKKESSIKALYKKELKRFFTSTVYVMNVGMGVIMAIIISVTTIVTGPEKLSKITGFNLIDDVLTRTAPFIISAIISMTCTTCVALSLEGKNLWIIKSLPLTTKNIFDSKILVNLTLSIPTSIICGILMAIGIKTTFIGTILLIATPVVYSLFTAVWGVFVNNRFANYDWESETQVIKQSISSIVGMFGGFLLALIPGILIGTLTMLDYKFFTIIVIMLVVIITFLLYKNEIKRAI